MGASGRRPAERGRAPSTAKRSGSQPGLAAVFIHLGKYHEECGELAQAEADYRQARKLQPGNLLPLALLGTLLRGRLPEQDLAALEAGLAPEAAIPETRARLAFALGHALDARGEYARAAKAFREANALSTLDAVADRMTFVPADHELFVDNVINRFDAAFFARTRGLGSDSRRPVFIFGLPRSGTSLIEQVLASHSQVHGAGELRLGRQSFEAIPNVLGRNDHPMECIRRPRCPTRSAGSPSCTSSDSRRWPETRSCE